MATSIEELTAIEELFNTPLPSSTPEGQALISTTQASIAANAEATQELQKEGATNLQQVLSLNAKAHVKADKIRDFNKEIAMVSRNNAEAAAALNKAPTDQYINSSTNKKTENNLNNAVENRQNLQAELNELNAEEGVLATIKRVLVAPILNRQLNQQDQNISAIQRRRAQTAIDYNQLMITNTRAVEQRSAKELAQVQFNATVSKQAFDTFRIQGQLSKDNIVALSSQAGLNQASTTALGKSLQSLKDGNRFYLDAVNAEIVKLQLGQQDTANASLKKSAKTDKEYYELQQVALDSFLEQSGRDDMVGKLTAQALLTTGAKAKDPLFSQFRSWQFTSQSSALAPFSSFQRGLTTGSINPNDYQQLAPQREAKSVISKFNEMATRANDKNAMEGKPASRPLLDINDPKDIAQIDQLIIEERALANVDATTAFNSQTLSIPNLKSFKDNSSLEAKEELLKTFPKDILDYIESGAMDDIPTDIGANPLKSIESTITSIAAMFPIATHTSADASFEMGKQAKVLAAYYGWARKGLATTSMQGLSHLRFRGVDSFRMGEGGLKDPSAFDITSEGQWALRLKRAYVQNLRLERLKANPAANLSIKSF